MWKRWLIQPRGLLVLGVLACGVNLVAAAGAARRHLTGESAMKEHSLPKVSRSPEPHIMGRACTRA